MPPRTPSHTRLSLLAGVLIALCASAGALLACDGAKTQAPSAAAPGRSVDPEHPFSRSDIGVRATDIADAGPAPTATVDPLAFDDFLKAAPSSAPAPTDPDGGTLLGAATATAGASSPITVEEPPKRSAKAVVQLGTVAVQSEMASAALEREARAQLYFPLVTRCRGKDGKILPPDAILLEFTIDADGYIVPQNISATATSAEHTAAAKCMRRELSGLPFRGPSGARGQTAQVKMTVPSVD